MTGESAWRRWRARRSRRRCRPASRCRARCRARPCRSLDSDTSPPRLGTSCHITPLACVRSVGFAIVKVAMYSTLPFAFSRRDVDVGDERVVRIVGSSSPKARPMSVSYEMSDGVGRGRRIDDDSRHARLGRRKCHEQRRGQCRGHRGCLSRPAKLQFHDLISCLRATGVNQTPRAGRPIHATGTQPASAPDARARRSYTVTARVSGRERADEERVCGGCAATGGKPGEPIHGIASAQSHAAANVRPVTVSRGTAVRTSCFLRAAGSRRLDGHLLRLGCIQKPR